MADATESKPEVDTSDLSEGVDSLRAREIFGELLSRACFGGERIVVRRHGKPVAVIVGLPDLERLRSLDAA